MKEPRPNKALGFTMTRQLLIALLLVGAAAVSAEEGPMTFNEGIVGKVALFHDGRVTYNGKTVTIAQLRKHLADLKVQNGVVWYYREDPMGALGEPPPIWRDVMDAVTDNRLPISISTESDYSTVALPDGTIKRRERK